MLGEMSELIIIKVAQLHLGWTISLIALLPHIISLSYSCSLFQIPAGGSGGANPGHRPECVWHGYTNGADSEED